MTRTSRFHIGFLIILPLICSDACGQGPSSINRRMSASRLDSYADIPCDLPPRADWQVPQQCGVNCIYALLKLCGLPRPYVLVKEAFGEVSDRGVSLLEMKDAAGRLDLPCRVIHGSIRDLFALDPPAVLHIGETNSVGHFILYLRRQGQTAVFLDGTTGGQFSVGSHGDIATADLSRQSSGYMLVPEASIIQKRNSRLWAMACILLVPAIVIPYVRWLLRRNNR